MKPPSESTAEEIVSKDPEAPGAADDLRGDEATRLACAREVFRVEAHAIETLGGLLDGAFGAAVDLILASTGNLVVTGLGKAGLIGQKISATFASTGTPSIFLHPTEALHGDLGRIRPKDVLLALSNSGETLEIKHVVPLAKKFGAAVIALTGGRDSSLASLADCVLDIGRPGEACPLGLAPTATTAAMLALGDALAVVVQTERRFSRENYALFHPAGSLGRRLMRVSEIMRQGSELPLAKRDLSVREVLLVMSETPGRPGAALIVDEEGRLTGIFTDGDFRRLLGRGRDAGAQLERPIAEVMGRDPVTIGPDQLVEEAQRLLRERRKDQLPVLDADRHPIGLVDVQDLLDVKL